jgi:hypothetical protein
MNQHYDHSDTREKYKIGKEKQKTILAGNPSFHFFHLRILQEINPRPAKHY